MMKALTIKQPWATLVAIGAKHYETRSWDTRHRGRIAIHAGKGFPGWAKDLCGEPAFAQALECHILAMPLGSIVATANLVATHNTNYSTPLPKPLGKFERIFGDFTPDRWAWELREVVALAIPIPCNGALGLWDVPPEIERKLRALK